MAANLPDGVYDIVVIDVDDTSHESPTIDVTITTGDHKGQCCTLNIPPSDTDLLDWLGLMGEVSVVGGIPTVIVG